MWSQEESLLKQNLTDEGCRSAWKQSPQSGEELKKRTLGQLKTNQVPVEEKTQREE